MTVTYNFDSCSTTWIGISKLLFHWRGSVWKAIIFDLIWWTVAYILLALTLHNFINDVQLANFEDFRKKLENHLRDYPMVFMLGFFVNVIFNRWVSIFQYIGFVDNLALSVSTAIKGTDIETRLLKRNIVRYSVLSQALVFRDISLECRTRFPDTDSLVDCGLMTFTEHEIYDSRKLTVGKFWIPIQWALNLLVKARDEGKIASDLILWQTQEKIREFRNNLHKLACYDWVPVPIAYPQIIYISVRCYFCILVIVSQTKKEESFLFYIPWVALIKFILMSGWVKVAESLINPFGKDDDDYECSYIIDRNLTIGFAIVDSNRMPPTDELDPFWSLSVPQPFDTATNEMNKFKKETPYNGSVAELDMSKTTNDPQYKLKRARRRTFIQRMISNQSSACYSPSHASATNIFFDSQNHPYTPSSAKRSQMSNFKSEYLSPFHQLDNVSEIDDEESRRASLNSSKIMEEDEPDQNSKTTNISIISSEFLDLEPEKLEKDEEKH